MKIDIEKLLKGMLEAASGVLKNHWPKAKDYTENVINGGRTKLTI